MNEKTDRRVEYFFDFGSPTTYLAHTQLPRLAADCAARLLYKPMLRGGVFKATGNASPVSVPAKGRWMHQDLQRWARRYGVPFAFNPHFPINTLTLLSTRLATTRSAFPSPLKSPTVTDCGWVPAP